MPVVKLNRRPIAKSNREVIHAGFVIQKEIFNLISFITQAKYEVLQPIVSVVLHDMPQHGPASDFDHRFRAYLGFFAQPSALASAEDNNLHRLIPAGLLMSRSSDRLYDFELGMLGPPTSEQ